MKNIRKLVVFYYSMHILVPILFAIFLFVGMLYYPIYLYALQALAIVAFFLEVYLLIAIRKAWGLHLIFGWTLTFFIGIVAITMIFSMGFKNVLS